MLSSFITIALLVAVLSVSPDLASAQVQCTAKTYIDYYGEWGPYYDACFSELKTTFEYDRGWDGSPEVWCQVDNTPFSSIYDAGEATGDPIVEHTHCTNLDNHRLLIDVQPTIGRYGFIPPMKLTAEYYEDAPN